jgi:hypothetical protein
MVLLNRINSLEFQISKDWFVQKMLILKHLPSLEIEYHETTEIKWMKFFICLPGQKKRYEFFIKYLPQFKYGIQVFQPELFCCNTDIVRTMDNHISSSGQICYFFPGDLTYKSGISCLYTIQSGIKWADCYDYWTKNQLGGWPSKEMPHGSYAPAYFNIHRPML